MIDRKRDLSILSKEQMQSLETKLAERLNEILTNAANEANQLLNQYQIDVKMSYVCTDMTNGKVIKPKTKRKS